jgi:hypothetical protein
MSLMEGCELAASATVVPRSRNSLASGSIPAAQHSTHSQAYARHYTRKQVAKIGRGAHARVWCLHACRAAMWLRQLPS